MVGPVCTGALAQDTGPGDGLHRDPGGEQGHDSRESERAHESTLGVPCTQGAEVRPLTRDGSSSPYRARRWNSCVRDYTDELPRAPAGFLGAWPRDGSGYMTRRVTLRSTQLGQLGGDVEREAPGTRLVVGVLIGARDGVGADAQWPTDGRHRPVTAHVQ